MSALHAEGMLKRAQVPGKTFGAAAHQSEQHYQPTAFYPIFS